MKSESGFSFAMASQPFMTTIINGTSFDKRLDYNDHNQVIEWQGRSLQSRSYEEVLAHDNN